MVVRPYPEPIQWLESLVRRFASTDLETTRANFRSDDHLDELTDAAMRLVADDAAGLFVALAFAESLRANGQVDESQRLLNVIEASKPVTIE